MMAILSPAIGGTQGGRCCHEQRLSSQRRNVVVRAVSMPAVNAEQVIADEKKYILQTYARPDVVFVAGEDAYLIDANGKRYLDMAGGIAVNVLGHSHPVWVQAVKEQAEILCHTSNLYHTVPQTQLAKKLVESSFADRAFFCNSGTEANEAAIKFCRKFAKVQAGLDPYNKETASQAPAQFVNFSKCFHGRTMGALSITYKSQYRTPFEPVMGPAPIEVPFLDLEAAARAIQKGKTCGVFVEPIQGEGGIHASTREFLQGLRKLCDEAGALLVFDEVQCGLGRSGKLWGHEHFDVHPDIMTLAKPLAGGMPIGAVLMKQRVADVMQPGDHGSTFAGGPLVTAVANKVFDVVADPKFPAEVTRKGERLREGLRKALEGSAHFKEVRGIGLLVGVQLDVPAGPVVTKCREMGVLVITAGSGDVVRLVPPLTLTDADIDKCVEVLSAAIRAL